MGVKLKHFPKKSPVPDKGRDPVTCVMLCNPYSTAERLKHEGCWVWHQSCSPEMWVVVPFIGAGSFPCSHLICLRSLIAHFVGQSIIVCDCLLQIKVYLCSRFIEHLHYNSNINEYRQKSQMNKDISVVAVQCVLWVCFGDRSGTLFVIQVSNT